MKNYIEYIKLLPRYKEFLQTKDDFDMWFDANNLIFASKELIEENKELKAKIDRLESTISELKYEKRNRFDSAQLKAKGKVITFPTLKPVHSNMPGYMDMINYKAFSTSYNIPR